MQNSVENHQPVAQNETNISWRVLWKNNWRYSHWLICSAVTTVICSEFYNILITLYPNIFFNFYVNIGLQSLLLANLLTYSAIVGLGLLTGWLFYSAHLALISIKLSYRSLAPVMKLWEQSPDLKLFLKHLLSQEHFLKLSEFLAETKLPQAFHQFLNQGQHSEDILHFFEILSQLWAIKSPDEKIKQFTLKILNDWQTDQDFKAQIEKISSLTQLLIKISRMSEDLFQLAITEHEKLEPHLSTLNQVTEEQDLLTMMIQYPQILPFYRSFQELEPVRQGISILSAEDFCMRFIHSQRLIDHWLQQHFYQQPEHYASLWHFCYASDKLSQVESLIQYMNQDPGYGELMHNFDFCFSLVKALTEIEAPSQADLFYKNLEALTSDLYVAEFCHILLQLYQFELLQGEILEKVIWFKELDDVNKLLQLNKKWEKPDFLQHLAEWKEPIQISSQPTDINLLAVPHERPRASWTDFFKQMSCRYHDTVLPQVTAQPSQSNLK